MKEPFAIVLEETSDPADVRAVQDGLAAYNLGFAPPSGHQPLTIFLRDTQGALKGGLLGGTYWGWLHVDILWLDQAARGAGLGSQILAAAEAEAVKRGCKYAHLDTFSFQARGFYEKQGYSIYGVLEDLPPGHTRYFLKKDLG